jgi:hypothetical protein
MRFYAHEKLALLVDGQNLHHAVQNIGLEVDWGRLQFFFSRQSTLVTHEDDPGRQGLGPQRIRDLANAILGIRDSGKTYTATEAAEELYDAGVPFIAWTLSGSGTACGSPAKAKAIRLWWPAGSTAICR